MIAREKGSGKTLRPSGSVRECPACDPSVGVFCVMCKRQTR
jgi:hypothetical protein